MALPQSAVSDLLEGLPTGEAVDLIGVSVRKILQELIEAEAASSSVPPVTRTVRVPAAIDSGG
jgi:hypothetical protein